MRKTLFILTLLASCAAAQAQHSADPDTLSAAQVDSILSDTIFQHLSEIEVKAIRPLVKTEVDRLAYDVQADADSRTNNALDMLRKVPLVAVDGQDNITVRGSSNFKIYKNGHPDPSLSTNAKDVLKAVPANMIKRIEVITEPGAKYDAEGVGAILNIVMLENNAVKGVTGTLTAHVDYFGNPRASAYVTAQVGPVVFSTNYGYHHAGNHIYTGNCSDLKFSNGNSRHSEVAGRMHADIHYGNIEASYEPDTLNLLTLSVGGFYYNTNGSSSQRLNLFNTATGASVYDYTTDTRTPKTSFANINGRADFQHRTHRPGETITLSYMLATSHNANKSNTTFTSPAGTLPPGIGYTAYRQDLSERFWEHTFQFDYTRPFGKAHTLETGLKYINRRNSSTTTMNYTGDGVLDFDSRFRHLTQVGAAYASYTFRHDKLTARAGLRYEWSYLSARFPDGSQDPFHRSINDWVPSATLNYQFDMAHSLKLGFSTGIQRPGITYLNPAVIQTPESVNFGNPALESARYNNLSLTYMQVGQKLTFNVSADCSFSNNRICPVSGIDSQNRTFSTYQNALAERWYGLNGFVQWQVFDKTQLMLNGTFGRKHYRSDALDLSLGRWESFFYGQLTQQLPWKLRFTASGGKWGGGVNDLYSRSGNVWFHSLSLQRSWLSENRLTVTIAAQNPFGSKNQHYSTHYVQGDYTGTTTQYWTNRTAAISVSYRFGSLRANVKKTAKTIDNNDVVGGASAGSTQGGQQQ